MFTSRITVPLPVNPETEDIFCSALGTLFTDDTQNSHGTPGSEVTYTSPRFDKIFLQIPAHPDVEDGRKLFAHYLWNAGVIAADAIEEASSGDESLRSPHRERSTQWTNRYWDVRGKRVLELGAGRHSTSSIVAALSGASSVIVTDHPSSPALTSSTIEQNVTKNLVKPEHVKSSTGKEEKRFSSPVSIYGYTWGTKTMYLPDSYGKPSLDYPGTVDRLIIADCLWMPSQHANLVQTITYLLDESNTESCALVVAGFHTGRGIVKQFFEVAINTSTADAEFCSDEVTTTEINRAENLKEQGRLEIAEIFEIDVDGHRREWKPVRPDETKDQAKRWCVCSVLRRKRFGQRE